MRVDVIPVALVRHCLIGLRVLVELPNGRQECHNLPGVPR